MLTLVAGSIVFLKSCVRPPHDRFDGLRGKLLRKYRQSKTLLKVIAEVARLRVIFGLSTEMTEYQREVAGRLQLPFALSSGAELKVTRALRLPVNDGQRFVTSYPPFGAWRTKRFTVFVI